MKWGEDFLAVRHVIINTEFTMNLLIAVLHRDTAEALGLFCDIGERGPSSAQYRLLGIYFWDGKKWNFEHVSDDDRPALLHVHKGAQLLMERHPKGLVSDFQPLTFQFTVIKDEAI
ncbi:MAG: hypothetical protein A2928_04005 [Candidatus Taylorbacteria bacterium RIFCSPLOWO2_01_FULL_45_15b]|uniref:Uncharacterized protein n=1 Tax=Candidatus Taylorbacteria bacterium RIFCSPLOWO2_01_FULL_45_15b TaxID=1802319 RepID=A0A1G2NG43_9BACT|nr:MAG: hypothetical protein A2928_04005 [Candidatus Taylorbacteria bacterium RIFCSPLOWO2_01_FULL_45_15b]